MKKVGIINYGAGNIGSLSNCLEALGVYPEIVNEPRQTVALDLMILPGVGAYRSAIKVLRERNLYERIRDHSKQGKPLLGICLGMHLLSSVGFEDGQTFGLNILGGTVSKNPVGNHTGWNKICKRNAQYFLGDGAYYFNHSYSYIQNNFACAWVEHMGENIISCVRDKNVVGVQFHPENSQRAGQNFFKELFDKFEIPYV